jgi:uncharacterized protein GlcG (DUF336 family)
LQTHWRKRGRLALTPLSVDIVNVGGALIAFAREDGPSNLRPAISAAKATGTLDLGSSSRSIVGIAAVLPAFMQAASALSRCVMVPAASGVIVVDRSNDPIGAIEISGDSPDNDEPRPLSGMAAEKLHVQLYACVKECPSDADPAVGGDDLSGQPSGFFARKKSDHARDILRLANPAKRGPREDIAA